MSMLQTAREYVDEHMPAASVCELFFEQHPELAALKKRLVRAGAAVALMSGSGSSVYGLFSNRNRIDRALRAVGEEQAFRIGLVSRVRYRAMWWRALAWAMN